jgi:hypothetical protein
MEQFEQAPPLHFVEVTNRNGFPISDRHDGVPYVFKPGEPLRIPADAATHFFGYPAEVDVMQAHTCKRWGWNTPDHLKQDGEGRNQADRYFGKIKIVAIKGRVVFDEKDVTGEQPIMPDSDDATELPNPVRARNRRSEPVSE